MEHLKAQGKSMIVISEELPEIIGMCDRIIVLKDGDITNTFTRSPQLAESEIINYMI
jgi:ribose transport system ATP-binding protein